ncbi:hypothetical protein PAHAL_8G263100 [Panicum hallii]|uniref:Uncharacterized protein n=2 Tax=Panicum hallii TaxID=206008 RepID=A0A2T8IAC1_9POAL|nr:hypothetical protein PAHAL_8G263100 [Panicum hallii]
MASSSLHAPLQPQPLLGLMRSPCVEKPRHVVRSVRVFFFVSDQIEASYDAVMVAAVGTTKQRMVIMPTPLCNLSSAASRRRSPHRLRAPSILDGATGGGTLLQQLGAWIGGAREAAAGGTAGQVSEKGLSWDALLATVDGAPELKRRSAAVGRLTSCHVACQAPANFQKTPWIDLAPVLARPPPAFSPQSATASQKRQVLAPATSRSSPPAGASGTTPRRDSDGIGVKPPAYGEFASFCFRFWTFLRVL